VSFGWEDLILLGALLVIGIGYARGDVGWRDALAYLAFLIVGVVWGFSTHLGRVP
jgi:hypothetical protein